MCSIQYNEKIVLNTKCRSCIVSSSLLENERKLAECVDDISIDIIFTTGWETLSKYDELSRHPGNAQNREPAEQQCFYYSLAAAKPREE